MGLIPPYDWSIPDKPSLPEVPEDLRKLARGIADDVNRIEGDLTPRVEDIESLGLTGTELRVISSTSGGAGTNVTTVASDIPQNYIHLLLVWRGGSSSNNVVSSLSLRFNNSSAAQYGGFNGWATGSAWNLNDADSSSSLRAAVVGSSKASFGTIWIPFYTDVNGGKTIRAESLARGISGSAGAHAFGIGAGIWTPQVPVTSIQIWPAAFTWNASGVQASLIGVK